MALSPGSATHARPCAQEVSGDSSSSASHGAKSLAARLGAATWPEVLLRTLRLQDALRGVSATDPLAMAAGEHPDSARSQTPALTCGQSTVEGVVCGSRPAAPQTVNLAIWGVHKRAGQLVPAEAVLMKLWLGCAGQLEAQAVDALPAGPLLALLNWLCNEALDTPAIHDILDTRVETALEASKGLRKAAAEDRKRINVRPHTLSMAVELRIVEAAQQALWVRAEVADLLTMRPQLSCPLTPGSAAARRLAQQAVLPAVD